MITNNSIGVYDMAAFLGPLLGAALRVGIKFLPQGINALSKALGPAAKEFAQKGGMEALKAGGDVFAKYGAKALTDPKIMAKASQEAMEAFKKAGGMKALGSGAQEFIEKGGLKAIGQTMAESAGLPGAEKIGEYFEKFTKGSAQSALGKGKDDGIDGPDKDKKKPGIDGKDDDKNPKSAIDTSGNEDGKKKAGSNADADDKGKNSGNAFSGGNDDNDNKSGGKRRK